WGEWAVCEADAVPSGSLEAPVAGAVLLEGVRGVVHGAAVELDYQALFRPRAIHLHVLDADVREWRWKPAVRRKARKRSSSSLLTMPRPLCTSSRTALRRGT